MIAVAHARIAVMVDVGFSEDGDFGVEIGHRPERLHKSELTSRNDIVCSDCDVHRQWCCRWRWVR